MPVRPEVSGLVLETAAFRSLPVRLPMSGTTHCQSLPLAAAAAIIPALLELQTVQVLSNLRIASQTSAASLFASRSVQQLMELVRYRLGRRDGAVDVSVAYGRVICSGPTHVPESRSQRWALLRPSARWEEC